MPRARMSRHELKSQDEITSTIQRLTELAYGRTKEIVIGVSVVVVLVLGIIGCLLVGTMGARGQEKLIRLRNETISTPPKAAVALQKSRCQTAIHGRVINDKNGVL